MNGYAAGEIGFPWIYGMNTILIRDNLTGKQERETVNHEKFEIVLMRRGVPYRKAHAAALKMDACVKYRR